jgi:antitoxin MazE
MKIRIGKWGNSLAIRIPGPFAKELNLKSGMEVDVSVGNDGLRLRTKGVSYTLEELLAKITPVTVHGETDWGSACGREAL